MLDNYRILIFSGNAHQDLAREISAHLSQQLGDALAVRFSDGELRVQIQENVRGADVFVIQPTCAPANDNIMELLIMLDALKRSSARRITAVIPYYGYGRQDYKNHPRAPISAKLVADLIMEAGAQRLLTTELHAGQIQGFFNIPVDHLFVGQILGDYLATKELDHPVVCSPDTGGMERARTFAKRIDAALACIDKRKEQDGLHSYVIGDVRGRDVIIFDDLIDSGNTMLQAIGAVRKQGCHRIICCACHAVFSGTACQKLAAANVHEIVVTNTIPISGDKAAILHNLKILSVGELISQAIRRVHHENSLDKLYRSSMFETRLASSA